MRIFKRILPLIALLTLLLGVGGLVLFGGSSEVMADEPVQEEVEPLKNLLTSGQCGLYVRPINEDVPIALQNPDTPLIPASITKAVTAASVLSLRDSLACFITPVWMCGELVKRPSGKMVLDGDIVICTVGDPTLGDDRFAKSVTLPDSVAAALKRLNIDSIAGCVRVDKVAFADESVPDGWSSSDLTAYYGAPLLASTYSHNLKGGNRGRVNMRPDTTLTGVVSRKLTKSGIALGKSKKEDVNSPQTALYLHRSPNFKEIMRSMMVRSDNLYAEGMLRTLAEGDTRANALAEEWDFLTDEDLNLMLQGVKLTDGSGLSRQNRVTPHMMANLLSWMAKSAVGQTYVSLFPVVGKEGTVRGMFKGTPLEGKLVLKSGTLTGVKCYAGYKLDDKTGRPTHAVVAMVNNCKDNNHAKADIQRAILKIFAPASTTQTPKKEDAENPLTTTSDDEIIEEMF